MTKIALIAMSGVRAHNEDLIRIGMTLPGFVERSKVIASLPSLSLLTLAALTPDRVEVSYHEVADIKMLGKLPECDLAAIATYSAQVKDAYELSRRYREVGVPTVLGGLHVTALPDEAARHCDAIVVGEGEISWPRLVEDFEAGRRQRRYDARREFDLAFSPAPRYDLLDPERYNRITVQTQRGCPWRCEFCAASIMLTRRYKLKPADLVVRDIRAIKSIWPRPFVEFADDNSFVNKAHAKELMRAIGPEDIRWFTESDIAVADDPALLDLMREAGCAEILIGLESPNPDAVDGLELRRNWKHQQHDRYRRAIETIQSHGIAVNGCFVLGLDGDTPAVFEAIDRFVDDSGLFDVQITVLTAFPGTPLYARLAAEGRLIEETAWEKCSLFDVNVRPKRMTADELQRGLIQLARSLYTEERRTARAKAFRTHRLNSVRRSRRKEVV